MSFNATIFKILISSPSDVKKEREIATDVIAEFNILHSQKNQIVLLPVHWETHSYPNTGQRPQEELNKQIVDDCDLLVGLFWTRVGTPTGVAISGTVEEIDRHTAKKKPAMLYFSQVPAAPHTLDLKQLEEVKKLKGKYQGTALYHEYDSPEKFKEKFRVHLTKMIFNDSHFKVAKAISKDSPAKRNKMEATASSPKLNEKEQSALFLAAKGDGTIIILTLIGGEMIQTTDQVLVNQDALPRELAAWKAAIKNLCKLGLVEKTSSDDNSEIYSVTNSGFLLTDKIQNGQQLVKKAK